MLLVGASQERLPAGNGGESLKFDQLRLHVAVCVVAERKIHGEKVRPRRFGGDGEAGGNGGPGMRAEGGRGELAQDVIGGANEFLSGGFVEEQR